MSPILALQALGDPLILIAGDLILDSYVRGTVSRISPEAPIPILEVTAEDDRLGGAGNVAANVASMGGRADVVGFMGDDAAGRLLASMLADGGITDSLVEVPGRRTTRKTRHMARIHQILRVDNEVRGPAPEAAAAALRSTLAERIPKSAFLVLSDYGKGTLDDHTIQAAIEAARTAGVGVLVDPSGADYARYQGATLMTPNRDEAARGAGMALESMEAVSEAASRLIEAAGLREIVITLGKEGVFVRTRAGDETVIPTQARAVFDVSGAGDTVAGVLALGLGSGLDLEASVGLANAAAGVVVGKPGTATVTREEVAGFAHQAKVGRILDDVSLDPVVIRLKAEGKRIVFTNGCFDILHAGHVQYLAAARAYGDVLIVGVNDDASVRRLKGEGRPVNSLEDRLAVLSGLECVDHMVAFAQDTPAELIERVAPDVLAKGEDWRDKEVVGASWVEDHGGQVVLVELAEGRSTTGIIERIRSDGG